MEMSLPTQGDEVDSFDDMEFNNELMKGIISYGYKPSKNQKKGIVRLCNGGNVIMQATPEPGKIATYCSAILQQLDYKSNKVQFLVVAFNSDYVDEIKADMEALVKHLNLKVQSDTGIIDHAHVVVGTDVDLYNLLEFQKFL